MVQDAGRDNGVVVGRLELLERDTPEEWPLRRARIDADDVVAQGRERGSDASLAPAPDLQHPRGRRRQLR